MEKESYDKIIEQNIWFNNELLKATGKLQKVKELIESDTYAGSEPGQPDYTQGYANGRKAAKEEIKRIL